MKVPAETTSLHRTAQVSIYDEVLSIWCCMRFSDLITDVTAIQGPTIQHV